MHEGGFAMWLTLAIFAASVAGALWRRRRGGDRIAFGGAIATLASGLLGMSTGLWLTATHAAGEAEILGVGIRESANNTVFAGALGLALAVLGLALTVRREAAPARA
ncbi:MAG TPA: hypothetical protein RMH99_10875 [Sandaracinaceae bacterium LLY-WYZ-13_1]|nr:hypothetical protein [Sandaracinaceae bacterium LLY-WYZ-13_1]